MHTCLDGLNDRQHAAVTAPLGHTLVLAGAGSGKTRVLVSRIAWLIEEHQLSLQSILAVTFTNKAAGEMKARLTELLHSPVQNLWVGTFHGLCHRLLRQHHEAAGLPASFHILDSDDQARLIKRMILALGLDLDRWPVKQAQHFINNKKDEGLRPQFVQVLSYGPERTLLKIYEAYEAACKTAGVLDFAELLLRTHELLRDNLELLAYYQQRFRAILVDEFQDTNTIQYAWIRLLAGENACVMAVGDDDQSIYGWRGAKVENIQRFTQDFPNTQLIRLEQNYRSTETILSAANNLIMHNEKRMGKDLWTAGSRGQKIMLYSAYNELEEARFVSERISMAMEAGYTADQIAILYRSNVQSRVLEDALIRAGIAYRIHGGLRFFERAEIKDTLAYLRLIANVNDDAAFERVLNFPARGIGEKSVDSLRGVARANSLSLWQATKHLLASNELSQRTATALAKFITLIEELSESTQSLLLEDQLRMVISKSGLHEHYAKTPRDQAESRLDNLNELVSAAKQFDSQADWDLRLPPLVAFLAHASLEAGEAQADEQDVYVHLMTLHAAKGLEFPLVFMVGMEEGVFPGPQSIESPSRLEEERRLCYVGMTRAMKQLIISYAQLRRQYGREERHRPSRFLKELPENLVEELRVNARYLGMSWDD
jgi:DNA helicase-2/ATP-dependent DNA helicase PcrA